MPDLVCRVCGSGSLQRVLERNGVPVHQNLVFRTQEQALRIRRGDLVLEACSDCGFVFNSAFDPALLEYGQEYDATQLSSPVFQEYVAGLVRHLIDERHVRNANIIEVGCGRGAFLRALVADPITGNRGVGFDPSYVGPDTEFDGKLRFERRFYDGASTWMQGDVVYSRHVIEHIVEPLGFLTSLVSGLRDEHSRVFLETPSVEWIFEHTVVWDLFYEHCSLFSPNSLTTACERVGLEVTSVRHVFGDQYIWLETERNRNGTVSPKRGIATLAQEFAANQAKQLEHWRSLLAQLAHEHVVGVWGAGAKGSTFVNLVDAGRDQVRCLIDMNPTKQGGYVPGTGHPIVAPSELAGRGITCAILLNPNYRDEVQRLLDTVSPSTQLIDLGAP
jgi:hypothetical protein